MNTLWVVGDSTLSSFEDKYFYPRNVRGISGF